MVRRALVSVRVANAQNHERRAQTFDLASRLESVGVKANAGEFGGRVGVSSVRAKPKRQSGNGFVSGSPQQLEELYRAAYVIFAGEYARQWSWRHDGPSLKIYSRIESRSAQSPTPLDRHYYYAPTALLDAFIEHNLPIGGQWHRIKSELMPEPVKRLSRFIRRNVPLPAKVPDLRADYRFIPHFIDFETIVDWQPTAHQQLEARLLIRDWMRETLPLAQFDRLKKYLAA